MIQGVVVNSRMSTEEERVFVILFGQLASNIWKVYKLSRRNKVRLLRNFSVEIEPLKTMGFTKIAKTKIIYWAWRLRSHIKLIYD